MSQLFWKNNSGESSLDAWMTGVLNRVGSQGTSGSSKGETKISTYDPYLSDLFLTGVTEG